MYKQVSPEEAEGSVFEKLVFGHDADVIVAFTNKTFIYLKAYHRYDLTELDIEHWDKDDFANYKLVESGLATQAEIDDWARIRQEKHKEKELRWKRDQLERLKKELGEI